MITSDSKQVKLWILDKDEEYAIQARSLGGLRDAMEGLERSLVAASDMPRSILFGETPGGLNSGENAGEIRSWYDHVSFKQSSEYEPRILKILRVVWRNGQPSGTALDWAPLWQPTDQEKATTQLTRAQRRSLDIASQVISADEARREPDVAEVYGIDPNVPAPVSEVDPAEGAGVAGPEPGETTPEDQIEELQVIAAADPSDIPEGEPLISAREAGERLGVGPGAIRAMAARGEIMGWRVGRQWRFAWSQIKAAASGAGWRGDVDPPEGVPR